MKKFRKLRLKVGLIAFEIAATFAGLFLFWLFISRNRKYDYHEFTNDDKIYF